MATSPIPVVPIPEEKVGWFRKTAHSLLQITHGRSTAFFLMFFISGNVFAAFSKLTPAYIGFMTALGGLILGHSIKEDWAVKLNGPRPPGGPDADFSRPY